VEVVLSNEKDAIVIEKKKIVIPKFSLDSKGVTLPPKEWSAKWCGTKSEHLHYFGNNLKLPGFAKVLNEGFVIPFSAYFKHLEKIPGDLLKNTTSDSVDLINKAIIDTEIDPDFLAEIKKVLLEKNPNNKPWILRSSTNAEDLVGFNGAGLYNSEILHDSSKLKEVIKRVWASVFSPKAYQERDLFKIEHDQVGMAILCQPLISDKIIAKGVAMTWSNIHPDFGSFLVNVQNSKGDVTDSSGVPEQIVLYVNDTILVQEVISRSNLMEKGQKHILDEDQLFKLWKVLNLIKRSNLGKEWQKYGCAADVEFMICDHDGEIFITVVQVRPYLIPRN
jgi:phosphoenolpyruvate synthase/pyruvate phosphate dikinase